MPNPGITVKNNTGSDHVRKGETKWIKSGKECKKLIPNKITKLRKKTHYICIYELKAESMNAYSGGMPGQHL